MAKGDVESRIEKLKAGASNLSISLQSHFWAFVSNQARLLINQKSGVFYDVMTSSGPNPFSSQQSVDAAGGFGVFMRSIRVLLIPVQKALQYYVWSSANKDYEEKLVLKIMNLEVEKREKENYILSYPNDIQKVALAADELRKINQTLEDLKKDNKNKNRNEIAGMKKPTFTWQDGMYLALDMVLLGLAIAALVYGASIPGAAIAVGAASISGVVAGVHYGKFVYAGYQLKKEDERLTGVIDKISKNENLNDNDRKFITEQNEKAKLEHPQVKFTDMTDAEMLAMRQGEVKKSLKQNIMDRYQAMRKTMGLGLTVMSIVAASLILVGMMMGPAGVPVIAAGVGLGLVTTGIAVGMMIVNVVKKNRDKKLERDGAKKISPLHEDHEEEIKSELNVKSTNSVVNEGLVSAGDKPRKEGAQENDNKGRLLNPVVQPIESVSAPSVFFSKKNPARSDDIEMDDILKKDGPSTK